MGVGLATPPSWIGCLLPESEECPGQLKWSLSIFLESGPKHSVYQYNRQKPIPKGTKTGHLARSFATPLSLKIIPAPLPLRQHV